MTWWGTFGAVVAGLVTVSIITALFGLAVAAASQH